MASTTEVTSATTSPAVTSSTTQPDSETSSAVEVTPPVEELAQLSLSGVPPETPAINHGGHYWAVYLAVAGSRNDDQLTSAPDGLTHAVESLRRRFGEVGVVVGDGGTDCDGGGRSVLEGYDADYNVAVYYEQESDARAFAAMLSRPPLGIGRIKAYCAD